MVTSLRTIGGHRLVAGLGKGGMSHVYLALTQKQFGFTKLLVLKVLRDELNADGEFFEMFVQEARLAARLNHPNVVQTYEVGEDEGHHFIAMEYLEGQALSSIVSRIGADKVPLEFQLRVLCDALEGLQYAHGLADYNGSPLGIVHRDVSPQNVFVTYTGQAKILDFGIAKSSSSARTMHGVLKGKAGYMAPEQATFADPDRRTDLFAIGVMLWEAIAKRRLVLRTEDDVQALMRRVSGNDPKIRDVAPDAPAELADICDKAMASDPNDRYSSAAELRDAIEGFLSKHPPYDARRIAAVLDEVFAEQRTRIRHLVDEQSKKASQAGPIIDLRGEGTVTPLSRMPRIDVDVEAPGRDEAKGERSSPSQSTGDQAFTSGRPTVAPPGRARPLVAVGALVLAIAIAGLVVVRRSSEKQSASPDPTPTASVTLPSTSSSVRLEPSAAAEPEGYHLRLTSEPTGARVYDGDAVIGRTPLELPINNAAIQQTPRHLIVRADGFEPYRVDPAPARGDLTTNVVLVSKAAWAVARPQPQPQPVSHPTPRPSAAVPATAGASTRPFGVEPPDPRGLRPLDEANPWEKKK